MWQASIDVDCHRGARKLMSWFGAGGQLREFTDEESNFAALLQRAMDLEGVDRETVHHLVTLLMKVRQRDARRALRVGQFGLSPGDKKIKLLFRD